MTLWKINNVCYNVHKKNCNTKHKWCWICPILGKTITSYMWLIMYIQLRMTEFFADWQCNYVAILLSCQNSMAIQFKPRPEYNIFQIGNLLFCNFKRMEFLIILSILKISIRSSKIVKNKPILIVHPPRWRSFSMKCLYFYL